MKKIWLVYSGTVIEDHDDFNLDELNYSEVSVFTSLLDAIVGENEDTLILEVEVLKVHEVVQETKASVLVDYVVKATPKKGKK